MIKDNMEFIKDCLFRIFVIASLVWYQVYAADPKDNKVNQESFFSPSAIESPVVIVSTAAMARASSTECTYNVSLTATYWNLPNCESERGYYKTKMIHHRKLPRSRSDFRHGYSMNYRRWKLANCGDMEIRPDISGCFPVKKDACFAGFVLPTIQNCARS